MRATTTRGAGRPREFDADEALQAALDVFWRHGFEGASLAQLTTAMGISRPSLYAAFGNKEALFRTALDRYIGTHMAIAREALDAPRAKDGVEAMLRGVVAVVTGPRTPPGCLTVQGALAVGPDAERIRTELLAVRRTAQSDVQARLQRAQAAGEFPATVDVADLARYVSSITQGIAVQAAGGAGAAELNRVVDVALSAWPN